MAVGFNGIYPNNRVTEPGYVLLERYDLHFKDSSSDKVYICTLQEKTTPDGSKVYSAVAYYGRRGANLTRNVLTTTTFASHAHAQMTKQMNTKLKKGYKDVGHYIDRNAKSSAKGILGEAVLEVLREKFPAGAIVESPNGGHATVTGVTDTGALKITMEDDKTAKAAEIPFGKYGMLKVIQ